MPFPIKQRRQSKAVLANLQTAKRTEIRVRDLGYVVADLQQRLAGIVVNNAIVLVDYLNQLRGSEPDLSVDRLIVRAGLRRFRPILMTTLTTVLAMLPIALGLGEGGELHAPMARVVIGGLTSGTLITLLAIPLLMHACLRAEKHAD